MNLELWLHHLPTHFIITSIPISFLLKLRLLDPTSVEEVDRIIVKLYSINLTNSHLTEEYVGKLTRFRAKIRVQNLADLSLGAKFERLDLNLYLTSQFDLKSLLNYDWAQLMSKVKSFVLISDGSFHPKEIGSMISEWTLDQCLVYRSNFEVIPQMGSLRQLVLTQPLSRWEVIVPTLLENSQLQSLRVNSDIFELLPYLAQLSNLKHLAGRINSQNYYDLSDLKSVQDLDFDLGRLTQFPDETWLKLGNSVREIRFRSRIVEASIRNLIQAEHSYAIVFRPKIA